ncbi:MAG: ZIP family metal transporter [Candidatus Omnitrophica bacterium]|nr:ZIP family metal transporter [Candidatus Omnitrophota bacterium]
MTLVYIIISTIVISLASLVGIFFISLKQDSLARIVNNLVIFATGVLLGGALLHLIPEALGSEARASLWIIAGIILFFILEKFLFWRHCHNGVCEIHPVRYLNLLGDGVHNFVDGTVIAAAFVADFKLGITVSIVSLAHEIPQEIGDFAILVHSGLSRAKALLYNLICATTCILGGIIAFFFASRINNLTGILIAFAGGNFLYMALVDLLPEFRKTERAATFALQFLLLCLGIFFMWLLKFIN